MIVPFIIVAAAVCSAGALAYKERDLICDYVEHKLMERRLRKRAAAYASSTTSESQASTDSNETCKQTPTSKSFNSQSRVHNHHALHSALGPGDEPRKGDYTEEIEMSVRRRGKRCTSICSDKTVGSPEVDSSNSFHMPLPPTEPSYHWSSSSNSETLDRAIYSHNQTYTPLRGVRPASVVSEQPSLSYSANTQGESTWGSSASDFSSDYDFVDERTSSESENVVVVDPSAASLYGYHGVRS